MIILFKERRRALPFVLITFLLLASVVANSQKALKRSLSNKELNDIAFSKNHISLSVIPLISQKASVQGNTNRYNAHATPRLGVEAGVDYHINFNRFYSFITGIHTGVAGRNFLFNVPKEELVPQSDESLTANRLFGKWIDASYTSLQLLLQKRWDDKANGFWNLELGFNVRYAFHDYSFYQGLYLPDTRQTYVGLNLFFGEKKPWLNYNIGGGHAWFLKNKNILQTNLMGNLSFTKYVTGNYQFTLPNQPVESGTYNIKGSSIGLSVSYIFTGAQKKTRKSYLKG